METELMRLYVFDDELKHYGTKGMHWGVRKAEKTSGRKTSLKPGDTVLTKGTTFQRIATGSNMSYTQGVYLSYASSDKDLYRGVLGRIRVSWLIQNEPGQVSLKQLTMTANKDIRIPSKEKRIAELDKLLKTDKKAVIDLINDGETYSHRSKGYDVTKTNRVDNTMYERFNNSLALGVDKHPIIAKYYGSLKKQGYDAIPDENDIRLSTFKARAPVIFFDTMESIGSIKVKNLTSGEVFSAYNRTVGKKVVSNLLMPYGVGRERLNPESKAKVAASKRQQQMDKYSVNKKYTMTDLATDWGVNRLTSKQIRKVNSLMDEGHTHDEAVKRIVGVGNTALDRVFSKVGL
jgi:hypothetical protein